MTAITYCVRRENLPIRKLRPKLPNYLIKRKILMIREKIIARKYGTIYLRKVFGKYYPSECGRYYRKKILRTSFEKLKAHWFEEREIHRLLFRADYYFKTKLVRKLFCEWRNYVVKITLIRQQERIVANNYEKRLLGNTLDIWKKIAIHRRTWKLVKSEAVELHDLMNTLLSLLKMSKYFCEEVEEYLLEIKAGRCGRHVILRKYTGIWKLFVFQQKNYRNLISKAENYDKFRVRTIYFARWQRYVCYKRTKGEIIELCKGLYEDHLLKTLIQRWKNKTVEIIIEKRQMLVAVGFYNKLVKRKLLITWRRYVRHKLVRRSLKHKASFFHEMRLKQKVINALLQRVVFCKNTKLAIQKLQLFYKRLLIVNVWEKWSTMIDEKNDSELREKLSLAISFYKRNTIRKYLAKWVQYKSTQQARKDLKLKVTDLCEKFYCEKYLNVWKMAYREKRRMAMLEEKAQNFYNDRVLQNAFLQWIRSYNEAIVVKAKYQKSVSFHEEKISRKCFAAWISFYNENIQSENLMKEAAEYYLQVLQKKVLNKLSKYVNVTKLKRQKVQMADKFYKMNVSTKILGKWRNYCLKVRELTTIVQNFQEITESKLKQKIIMQWKLYVHHKKCINRKTLISETHYRKKIYSAIFRQMKNYVKYRKDKKIRLSYLSYAIDEIQSNMIAKYFQQWRVAQLNVLKEKSKMFHAVEFHQSRLKRRYFLLWTTFVIRHKIKRKHQKSLNDKMDIFVLQKCLRIWYMRYEASIANHSNEQWASKIYEMKIEHKYFIAWKYFSEIRTREKTEINNAKEFHKQLIVKEGLQRLVKLYLSSTELRFENHLKNVARNSSYEFELLRKYFTKWHTTVSRETKNRSSAMKEKDTIKNIASTVLKNNDRKYVSDLIPRFVIPEFMKDELKLRFGIKRRSNQIPFTTNKDEVLKVCTMRRDHSYSGYKPSKDFVHSEMDVKSQTKTKLHEPVRNQFIVDAKRSNCQMLSDNVNKRSSILNAEMKVKSPNEVSHLLSPDSLKSDSDSANTYTIQNPVYLKSSPGKYFCSGVPHSEFNKENNLKLLPPAAFCVSLNEKYGLTN